MKIKRLNINEAYSIFDYIDFDEVQNKIERGDIIILVDVSPNNSEEVKLLYENDKGDIRIYLDDNSQKEILQQSGVEVIGDKITGPQEFIDKRSTSYFSGSRQTSSIAESISFSCVSILSS